MLGRLASTQSTLSDIAPKTIAKNRDNPRLLFDESDLEYLQQSIKKSGILVPLIVYESGKNKYTLLDGERRLRCAKNLNMEKVPVNVIDKPTKLQNLLLMFNIHNVREDWELVPTALKLQTILNLIPESPTMSNKELSNLTGMSNIRITECKRILTFDQKYINLALEPEPKRRIRGDFFSQLQPVLKKLDDYPSILSEYPKEKIIDTMIKKYRDGTIANHINDFRRLRTVLRTAKTDADKQAVSRGFKKFLQSERQQDKSGRLGEAMTIDELFEASARGTYEENAILRKSSNLQDALSNLNTEKLVMKKEIGDSLRALQTQIRETLKGVQGGHGA